MPVVLLVLSILTRRMFESITLTVTSKWIVFSYKPATYLWGKLGLPLSYSLHAASIAQKQAAMSQRLVESRSELDNDEVSLRSWLRYCLTAYMASTYIIDLCFIAIK